jgi:hypothetical protein
MSTREFRTSHNFFRKITASDGPLAIRARVFTSSVGDAIYVREFDAETGLYSGRTAKRQVREIDTARNAFHVTIACADYAAWFYVAPELWGCSSTALDTTLDV